MANWMPKGACQWAGLTCRLAFAFGSVLRLF